MPGSSSPGPSGGLDCPGPCLEGHKPQRTRATQRVKGQPAQKGDDDDGAAVTCVPESTEYNHPHEDQRRAVTHAGHGILSAPALEIRLQRGSRSRRPIGPEEDLPMSTITIDDGAETLTTSSTTTTARGSSLETPTPPPPTSTQTAPPPRAADSESATGSLDKIALAGIVGSVIFACLLVILLWALAAKKRRKPAGPATAANSAAAFADATEAQGQRGPGLEFAELPRATSPTELGSHEHGAEAPRKGRGGAASAPAELPGGGGPRVEREAAAG
ncbi:hypothetical protein UVI_02030030 [Ustilaginoidea virens]|nr:hypothetical protein UVI_02030030 [Ustilaginoidea virens]